MSGIQHRKNVIYFSAAQCVMSTYRLFCALNQDGRDPFIVFPPFILQKSLKHHIMAENNSATFDPAPYNSTVDSSPHPDTPALKNDLHLDSKTIALYVSIGLVGVFGNSFAIFILSRSASMRKKLVNVFLINQSAIDLVVSVLLLSVGYNKTTSVIVTFTGVGAELYCKLIGSRWPLWSMFVSSTWNLVFVNMERCLSVVYPIFHKTAITKSHIIASIVFIWLTGPILKIIVLMLPTDYKNGTCKTAASYPSTTLASAGGAANITVQFLLPLVIIVCCYTFMIKVLRSKSNVSTPNGSQQESKTISKSKNIFKTLAMVTMVFVVCWTPNTIIFLLYIIGNIRSLSGTLYHISVYLVFLNCCLNPVIYSAQYKDFQLQIKKVFCSGKVGVKAADPPVAPICAT